MSLVTLLLGGLVLATHVNETEVAEPASCRRIHTPGTAARCAAAHAPAVEVANADVDVAQARRGIARTILPEHPTVDVMVARRSRADERDVNVYGTLRQPIEIGGQRRTRTRVADAEIEVARAEVATARRRAAGLALVAYYEVVAAQRRGTEMTKVLDVTRRLESLAAERVGAGASAGIEHELARAARILAERRVLDARREQNVARVRLGRLVGADAKDLDVAGELAPLDVEMKGAPMPPEVAVVSAQLRAHEHRTKMLRRTRVPTPALIATVQRDGFGELVAGGGISIGIPLPSPLGPNKRAEIAQSVALGRRTRADQLRLEHEVAIARETAVAELDARRETLAIYDPTVTQSASVALDALAEAMVAGQLDLRDALLAQRTLLELLQGRLEAEYELCVAALDAAHASGRDLEAIR
jgi:cobalt-zinc-cadmium efflux system outer membrane protein